MADPLERLLQIRKGGPHRVQLPSISDVLYTPPNPDGTTKQCGNCYKWSRDHKCLDVEGDLEPSAICGYHVYGVPANAWMDIGQSPVTQLLAGVVDHPTSCGSCRFSQQDGTCLAVMDTSTGQYAKIEPLGCCTRWQGRV